MVVPTIRDLAFLQAVVFQRLAVAAAGLVYPDLFASPRHCTTSKQHPGAIAINVTGFLGEPHRNHQFPAFFIAQ